MTARAQLRAAPLLAFTLASCTLAGPRPEAGPPAPEPVEAPAVEPEVRVGVVVAAPTVEVMGTGELELVDEAGRVLADGAGPWTARAAGAGVALAGEGTVRSESPVVVRPRSGQVRVDGAAYHGAVLLRPAAGDGITAVNLLELETYLRGVVPLEIGAGRPPAELEAVKAQAIAARTYAIRHLGRRDSLGFDFFATVNDQVYGGAEAEDPVASRAVRDTRGEVLVHDGRPIEAYYHSTCGGRTAALEEVWDGDPRPYLQSVSDRMPGGGWYCESSNRFRWAERWDAGALHATLTAALQARGVTGTVDWVGAIEVTGRTPSGRAEALVIETNQGRHRIPSDSIRWVLRPEPDRILNSTAIDIDAFGTAEIRELVVEGAGWGHGIGMCQVGALGRAREGHGYRDILLTYYPGSRIERLY
jgi:stage II sporulation protein D